MSNPDMVTANHCKEGESFISDSIIARLNLSFYLEDNTIKLTWKELSEGSAKTYRTRFRIIADNQIHNDIAIGKNACNEDEDERSVSEPMNQLTIGECFPYGLILEQC